MVNFRIYEDFDPLFKNLIIPSNKDWDSLGSTAFLGRYMREKSTGSLYRTRGLYHQHPDFKTKGYHIKRSVLDLYLDYPEYFPVSLPSPSLKEICRGLKYRHFSSCQQDIITLNIIFRNLEDYLKAEKELNVCKTHILEIPILSSQLKDVLPQIYKRFENLVENKEELLYLYKPNN